MARALKVCGCRGCASCGPGHCTALVKAGRCAGCSSAADRKRGSRQERGYDAEHDAERRRWVPVVAAGGVLCARPGCGREIRPKDPWDLGHQDDDRSKWTGPEHRLCNRSAGGRRAHGLPPKQ